MAEEQEIVGSQKREGRNASHTSRKPMDEKRGVRDAGASRDSTGKQTAASERQQKVQQLGADSGEEEEDHRLPVNDLRPIGHL